jgi:membrane associated rhomboid family serine protease
MLLLVVTVGATALALALGGAWWVVRELARQPGLVLERVAAIMTLVVGFGLLVHALIDAVRH